MGEAVRGGDISNRVALRTIFIFEDLVAHVPNRKHDVYRALMKIHQYRRAIDLFRADEYTLSHSHDMLWRYDFRFDVVTFLPDGCLRHIEKWLERKDFAYSHLKKYASAVELEGALASMPEVARVFYPASKGYFSYGHRGQGVSQDGREITL